MDPNINGDNAQYGDVAEFHVESVNGRRTHRGVVSLWIIYHCYFNN